MKDGEALSNEIVETLDQLGFSLDVEHLFNFYLYFKNKVAAEEVGTILSAKEFETIVNQSEADGSWLCRAQKSLVPNTSQIGPLAECFEDLTRKYEGVFDGWERVPQTGEKHPPALSFQIGAICYTQGEFEKAIEILSDVADNDSSFTLDACRLIANSYLKLERWDFAENFYTKILAVEPHDHETLTNMGVLLLNQNRFDEALSFLHKSIELAPDDGLTHYNLACAFVRIKESTKAIDSLRKVLELDQKRFKMMIEQDPDFEPLRPLPEYKELLKKKGILSRIFGGLPTGVR